MHVSQAITFGQRGIERVQREKITMCSGRRTRPPISLFPEIVLSLDRPLGNRILLDLLRPAPMFQTTQWTHVPAGASGSSTIRARDRVFSGMSAIERVGLTSAPSQVYFDGIIPLWGNTGLAISSLFIVLSPVCTPEGLNIGRLVPSGETNRRAVNPILFKEIFSRYHIRTPHLTWKGEVRCQPTSAWSS